MAVVWIVNLDSRDRRALRLVSQLDNTFGFQARNLLIAQTKIFL